LRRSGETTSEEGFEEKVRKNLGFTIVELLTVMSILAILMAIAVPVFLGARENANRGADISAMNTLRSALQLYYTDNGQYPPALFGYVTNYTPGAHGAVPVDKIKFFLYPRRINSPDTFRPAHLRLPTPARAEVLTNILPTMLVAARYPNKDPRPVGSAPQLDLTGEGRLIDLAGARQAFGPEDGYVALDMQRIQQLPQDPNDPNASKFFRISGYDVSEIPLPDTRTNLNGIKNRVELRYTRFWTIYALQGDGDRNDDPRQLGYADPPDNTVVTWDSYFRRWEGSGATRVPTRDRQDIILFLGGAARPFNSRILFERSWRVLPNEG
jgi:prepilin-type N-terminal cleavage/methylation domain-containing protein